MTKLTPDERQVYQIICENPGIEMRHVAFYLNKRHAMYGMQRAASTVIASLRKKGLIKDCPRCDKCHRATSRARRHVGLYPTNMIESPALQPTLF